MRPRLYEPRQAGARMAHQWAFPPRKNSSRGRGHENRFSTRPNA
ncbi:Uncharacterised protein [Mycobacterium tuberculosis]|nr:Uncharacterised protein [Mycobacterium tuberculosis]